MAIPKLATLSNTASGRPTDDQRDTDVDLTLSGTATHFPFRAGFLEGGTRRTGIRTHDMSAAQTV